MHPIRWPRRALLSLGLSVAVSCGGYTTAGCNKSGSRDAEPEQKSRETLSVGSPSVDSPPADVHSGPAPPRSGLEASPVAGAAPLAIEPADLERGRSLVELFECNRCHAETGGEVAVRSKDCVGCHDEIANGRFPAPASALSRWKKTTDPYTVTPSLLHVGQRLRRDWVVAFLRNPMDLRPKLAASMPRLALSEQDARDLAAYLTRDAGQGGPALAGDPQRGRSLVEEKSCGSCHAFTGAAGFDATFDSGDERQKRAIRLAPDLRFTRERFVRGQLVRWLVDPLASKADSLMPNHGLSNAQAADIAAYLFDAPLAEPKASTKVERLPVLKRRVSYDEVNEKVLHVTCRHCHSDPDASMGDGGPGNTGGFGFAPKKLDLASYRGVAAGYVDATGQRQSVFAPLADGTPRLVGSLLARQAEQAGIRSDEIRGMPLGLPALSAEQVQLVESWVAQGRPR